MQYVELCVLEYALLFSLQSLGQIGVVFEVDNDGDVRIRVSGTLWTFSPAALTKNLKSTTGNIDDRGNFFSYTAQTNQFFKLRDLSKASRRI